MFQSAPRSRDRGDCSRPAKSIRPACFNPRPGLATGATTLSPDMQAFVQVSIRAPVSRPGRPPTICTAGSLLRSFNPRPGLATGATEKPVNQPHPSSVSIRAPVSRPGRQASCSSHQPKRLFQSAPRSRDRGDLLCGSIILHLEQVSIRAPVSRPGRPLFIEKAIHFPLFQSAPRSRDRGDKVSIRLSASVVLFQSAPRSRDRGDSQPNGISQSKNVSIRAPVSRPGRPTLAITSAVKCFVSIRAPVSRPGRRASSVSIAPGKAFQSAPRSRDRGDIQPKFLKIVEHCFNPRPGLATGATCTLNATL